MKLTHLLVAIISVSFFISGCFFGKNGKDNEIPTDREMMATANMQYEAGQYQDAVNTLQSLIINYPISDLHIDAQLKTADAYGKMEDFETQMDVLLTLLKENIIPEKVPRIYIQIAKFYVEAATFNPGTVTSDTVDYNAAIDYFTKAYQYKDSDETEAKAEAMYGRAMTEARMGNLKDAVAHYKLVKTLYPESNYAPLANIKFKNPNDLTELSASPDSLESYLINQYSPEPETSELPPPPPESFEMEEIQNTDAPAIEETQPDNLENVPTEEPMFDATESENTINDENLQQDLGDIEPAASDTSGLEM